jgi:predicted RNase H-like nuclease
VLFVGIDLAWKEGNESGLVALSAEGRVVEAGWTQSQAETLAWIERVAGRDTILFVDAPLVVLNEAGQRLCEKEVAKGYWRWQVYAHSTNRNSPRLAGVDLRERLEERGWSYSAGIHGPPSGGLVMSECYPNTTIVGAVELGYADERPRYKERPPKGMRQGVYLPLRLPVCDELIRRVDSLRDADPRLDLRSHPVTRLLLTERSPLEKKAYKHREDLLDAAICAWTAALWHRFGLDRCQVLGGIDGDDSAGTIIAPARPEQRLDLHPAVS